MFMLPLLIAISPVEHITALEIPNPMEQNFIKKKKASGGAAARFKSCAAAKRAGYSNMRRGQKGYSKNLDRDGDGLACDK